MAKVVQYKAGFGTEYKGNIDQVRESVPWCQQGVRAVWEIHALSSPITRAKSLRLCTQVSRQRICGVGCLALRRTSTMESLRPYRWTEKCSSFQRFCSTGLFCDVHDGVFFFWEPSIANSCWLSRGQGVLGSPGVYSQVTWHRDCTNSSHVTWTHTHLKEAPETTTTTIQSGEAPFSTGEEPPPHSGELKHLSPKQAAQPNPSNPALCRQDTTSPWSTDYEGNILEKL